MLEPGILWTPNTNGFWILQFFEFLGRGKSCSWGKEHKEHSHPRTHLDSCVTVRTFSETGNMVERLRTSMAAGESIGHSD